MLNVINIDVPHKNKWLFYVSMNIIKKCYIPSLLILILFIHTTYAQKNK